MFPIGDREVLCLISHEGIRLWFFNPSVVPDFLDDFTATVMDY